MKSIPRSSASRSGRAYLRSMVAGIGALTLAVSIGLAVGPAQAINDEGFELDAATADTDPNTDGVAVRNNGATSVDWEDLFTVSGAVVAKASPLPADYVDAAFRADYALPDTTGYATGSKDNLPISLPGQGDWQCKQPNNLGDKFDLVNAYAAAKLGGASAGDPGDVIVYFGSEVSAPEGNRNMGVWLLQDPTVGCTGGNGNTDFTGSHKYGDAFIVAAFTGGGAVANIDVYEWVDQTPATPNDDPDVNGGLALKGSVTSASCSAPPTADDACAAANTDGDKDGAEEAFSFDPEWPAPDKDGDEIGEAQFMEGAVNLTDFGLTGCFSTFLANSRSSQELGSTIHDFARADFNTCGRVNIIKTDDANNALNGATFTLYRDNAPVGGTLGAEDTATSMTCTTSGTGTDAGKCSITNVPFGNYWVVETTTPAGYTTAAPQTAAVNGTTSTVTLTFIDVRLFKMIVVTCNTASETLVDSTVTLTGTPGDDTRETIKASQLPTGLTEAALCGLAGANYDDLPAATYAPSVELPDASPFFPVVP